MGIVYFFRNPNPGQHSIEELFANIQKHLPGDLPYKNYIARHRSKGLLKRISNSIHASFNQGDINHITGDIHYIACCLKTKKTILTIHDIGSILHGNRFKRMIIKLFWFTIPARLVGQITVISEYTKLELLKHVNVNPNKVRVIHNCMSPLITYTPKDFNKAKPSILQIGTKANKNLPVLIEALEGISCKLIIIGLLSKKQKLMLYDRKIEYQNYCDVEFAEILNLYKQSDILTLISTYEGFGVPVIEAQAIGRPVITSNIGPMPEVAGNAAMLVNPYNVREIKNSILEIIEDDSLREGLILKGLENAKRFRADAIAEEYYKLYKEIIQDNS